MHWADIIAEQRLNEAARKGELSGLDGEGAPLDLSEDPLVPSELRAIHRVLKHAGYAPPEIAAMRAIADLEQQLAKLPDSEKATKAQTLLTNLAMLREVRNITRQD